MLMRFLLVSFLTLLTSIVQAQQFIGDSDLTWSTPSPSSKVATINNGYLLGTKFTWEYNSSLDDIFSMKAGTDVLKIMNRVDGSMQLSLVTAKGTSIVELPAALLADPTNTQVLEAYASNIQKFKDLSDAIMSDSSDKFIYAVSSVKYSSGQAGDDPFVNEQVSFGKTLQGGMRRLNYTYGFDENGHFGMVKTGISSSCRASGAAAIGASVATIIGCGACAATVITGGITIGGCFTCAGGIAGLVLASQATSAECVPAKPRQK